MIAGTAVSPQVHPAAGRGRRCVALVELWRLGDAVAATAGLQALRAARPEAEIVLVAHPENGDPLFRLAPDATHVPFAAFWTRGKRAREKYLPWTINYRELVGVRRRLRALAPDVYLLFRGDLREQLFFSSLGRAEIVDFPARPDLLPWVRRTPRPAAVPRHREYVHLVRAWSGADVDAEPRLAGVPRGERRSTRYVVVHPGASWRFKQWSPDRLAAVIQHLGKLGVPVKLVGAEPDRPLMDAIRGGVGAGVEALYPSLEDFYGLVAGAQLVICHNSAALHIAEALGTPCLALTGPNDPVRWGTYQPHSRTIQRSVGLPCHPCAEKRCVRPLRPCIEEIRVDDVLLALYDMSILGSAPAGATATDA